MLKYPLLFLVLFLASCSYISYDFDGWEEPLVGAVPTTSNIFIFPSPIANDSDNLTMVWTSTDTDGDNITNITDWRRNGTSIALIYMPFEPDGLGNITVYSSLNIVNFTIRNNTIWNKTVSPYGGAYECGGVNSTINKSGVPEIDLPANAPFSFSALLRAKAGASNNVPINLGTDSTATSVHFIFRTAGQGAPADGALCFDYFGGTAQACTLAAFPLNEWKYVVATYDGSTMRMYLNGVVQETLAGQNINLGPGQVTMCRWIQQSLIYSGFIDEFKFYNRTLKPEQIVDFNTTYAKINYNETRLGEDWNVCITPNTYTDFNGQIACSLNTTIQHNATCGNFMEFGKINCSHNCQIPLDVTLNKSQLFVFSEGNLTIKNNASISNYSSVTITGDSSSKMCNVVCSSGGCFK